MVLVNVAPVVETCSVKPDCPNYGLIVVDANFAIYLVEAICGKVEAEAEDASRADKFASFSAILASVLQSIRSCAIGDTLWTSDLVYQREISPVNRISSLRRHAERFERMCQHSNRRYNAVNRVLTNHLTEAPTNTDDLASVKNHFQHRPNDEDASLISLSARSSAPRFRTILLTDDDQLCDRIETIVRMETLNLGDTDYHTSRIFPMNFLNFLERVHDCCNLTSDSFMYCMHHKYLVEGVRDNRALRARKMKRVERVWYMVFESFRRKLEPDACSQTDSA
jgi:hypothetical protein